MGIMSGRIGLFPCEVMVVVLVAAGEGEGMQIIIKKKKLSSHTCSKNSGKKNYTRSLGEKETKKEIKRIIEAAT